MTQIDMKMPNSCEDCKICKYDSDFDYAYCPFVAEGVTQMVDRRHPECPLKEPKQGEWIPIKTRLMDPEERASFAEYWEIDYADTQLERAFDCFMPEDQERILICTKWGVDIDTCEYDPDEGYSLEDRGDWEDVIAWMPLPEPYKGGEAE